MKLTQEQIDRMRVEEVFLLTGGELSDKPAQFVDAFQADGRPMSIRTICYTYDGLPEYAAREDFDTYAGDSAYFTAISFGQWADILIDSDGSIWCQVAAYGNSGERECPFATWHPTHGDTRRSGRVDRETAQLEPKHEPYRWYGCKRPMNRQARCPYCANRIGEEHGHIYLGDGAEVVYARVGYVRGAHPEDGSCDCSEVELETTDGREFVTLECGAPSVMEDVS